MSKVEAEIDPSRVIESEFPVTLTLPPVLPAPPRPMTRTPAWFAAVPVSVAVALPPLPLLELPPIATAERSRTKPGPSKV